MSTLRLDTIQDQAGNNASTPDEIYSGRAKAWVNFNGTFGTSPFTIGNGGIRAAFNVSSITDNGTGDYTMNFTTALPDANYAVTGCYGTTSGSINFQNTNTVSVQLELANSSGTLIDRSFVTVAIFR